MTQTIEYVVKVNATQAQAAVADVEKRFGGVDTVVARVDKSIIALERDMKDLNAAIAAGGPNVEHYRKELEALSPAAARATGGRNMGGGLLQLSQTVDDLQYGIRGVVNNIPGLVQGFGISAGIAGGAQLAFIAVNQLTDKLTDYIKKQQEASQAAIKGRLSLLDVRIQAMQETADLQAELDRLTTEISGGTSKVTENASKARLADLRTNIANAEEDIVKRQGVLQMLERMQFRSDAQDEQIKATKAYIQDRRNRIEADKSAIEQEIKNQELREKIAKAAEELANKNKPKASSGGRKTVEGFAVESGDDGEATAREEREQLRREAFNERVIDMQIKADEKLEREAERHRKDLERAEQLHLSRLEQLEGDSLAARMAFHTVAMNRKMENLDKLKAHEFNNLKDTIQAWQKFYDEFANMGMEAMSMLAGATQDYIQMKIEGEKNAEMLAGAALMKTAGQALVGHGINLAGQAVVSAFTPGLQPLAAAQGVASAALIGAGIGLGAGGASLSHIAAGGTVGKPIEDKKAAKDRGASPRSGSGGGGGSGGLVVNVSYGAGGPLPEDIAREIDKVVKSNDRRRGAA